MNPEYDPKTGADQDMLSPAEALLGITAAVGIIGSMALKGRASNKAFWAGTAALIPFAYRMKKQEEAWHRENPWLRSSAPIH